MADLDGKCEDTQKAMQEKTQQIDELAKSLQGY